MTTITIQAWALPDSPVKFFDFRENKKRWVKGICRSIEISRDDQGNNIITYKVDGPKTPFLYIEHTQEGDPQIIQL